MDDKVFYPHQKEEYPVAVKGEGIYLWDDTGKKYVDACSGPVACIIGHGIPEIREAVVAQMEKLEFAHRFKFINNPTIKLADMIAATTPGNLNKILFLSGGSESTEAAMKMAHAYYVEKGMPTKYKVIARRMSYHGNTLGALSMGGHVNRKKIYAPMLADFPHVSPPNCYHCPFKKEPETCCVDCALDFEIAIMNEGPENVAAVIVEPISGAGLAAVTPDDRYMAMVREICDKYDVLMIVDEVMTGMGRTGKTWAIEHWNVVPDMITMAKGVSGGYLPIGAVAVKEEIYETFKQGSGNFTHGHTYGSHPVCSAAGIAVLNYVKDNKLVENSAVLGEYLREKLEELAESNQYIGEVRGKGLMLGVEFVKDKATRTPFDPEIGLTDRIVRKASEKGLLIYAAAKCIDGTSGDAIMIAPPLTVSKEEINMIMEMFEAVLKEVFSEL